MRNVCHITSSAATQKPLENCFLCAAKAFYYAWWPSLRASSNKTTICAVMMMKCCWYILQSLWNCTSPCMVLKVLAFSIHAQLMWCSKPANTHYSISAEMAAVSCRIITLRLLIFWCCSCAHLTLHLAPQEEKIWQGYVWGLCQSEVFWGNLVSS